MIRFYVLMAGVLATAAALVATACVAVPASPVAIADATVLDEQAALAAELAYQAAGTAVLAAKAAGLVPAGAEPCVAELDRQAYRELGRVRAAYRAGNAATYAGAMTSARGAISGLLARRGC